MLDLQGKIINLHWEMVSQREDEPKLKEYGHIDFYMFEKGEEDKHCLGNLDLRFPPGVENSVPTIFASVVAYVLHEELIHNILKRLGVPNMHPSSFYEILREMLYRDSTPAVLLNIRTFGTYMHFNITFTVTHSFSRFVFTL